MVKSGLRLQILILLGALLVLGFVPLYLAVEAYLGVALGQTQRAASERLGRTISAFVSEAVARRAPQDVEHLLGAQVSAGRVEAIAVYDGRGTLTHAAGSEAGKSVLPARNEAVADEVQELAGPFGRLVRVTIVAEHGSATTVLRQTEPRAPLLTRLLALYMSLVGLLFLAVAYLTLTRWIVVPIAQLSHAAQRVAQTTRKLELPMPRSREFGELTESLQRMTAKLLQEEQALRDQVAEVERTTEQLKSAQAHLLHAERMASVGQLAAGLAHEVGNPIAAMMGMQDLLLTGELSAEEQLDFVRRMRKETERIHRILRDLLDLARSTSRSTETAEPGSIEVAVHETTTLLLPQPVARNVSVEIDVFPDLPAVALSQAQLTQVLLNLLLNAAAACKQGGKIKIGARRSNEQVVLQVEDDGPGVPEALRERIFDPFVSSKDVGEGSGLGLSVCRALVEAAGGSIVSDAEVRRGARFVVRLPVAQPPGATSHL